MRFLLLICLFALTSVSLSAQADVTYRLRQPSAEEYLAAVPKIRNCYWPTGIQNSTEVWNLCGYLIDVIETNYADDLKDIPYSTLVAAYDSLLPGLDINTPGNPDLWNTALVMAWLRDNDVDLTNETELLFGQLTVKVQPRDFNADGIDEYVLDVTSSNMFATYMVLEQTVDGSYRYVPSPLPYHQSTINSWDWENSYLHEVAFHDFNGDGLPEWFLVFEGSRYWDNHFGAIYLLGWRDGRLEYVVDEAIPYIPFFETNATNLADTSLENGYLFANVDDDSSLEMTATAVDFNNWRCAQTDTRVFDWNDEVGLYIQQPNTITFQDTLACVVAPAESRFWERDYTTAARLYEYALTLPVDYSEDNYFQELKQYIQLRLVQSYLISEQLTEADQLLEALQDDILLTRLSQNMFDLLMSHTDSEPVQLCTAFYNLFEEAVYQSFRLDDFLQHFETQLLLGINERYTTSGFMPNPAFAGCNVPDTVGEILERDLHYVPSLPEYPTPAEQLLQRGFLVDETIQEDFNGDGAQDWLIWHEAHIPQLLLVAQPDLALFAQSSVAIGPYERYAKVETLPLPDGAGTAVVTFLAKENLPPGSGGRGCGENNIFLGWMTLWQHVEDKLTPTETSSWCDDRPSLDQMFVEEAERNVFYGRDEWGASISYVWDADIGRYRSTTTQTTAIAPIPSTPQPTPSNEQLYDGLRDGSINYFLRLEQQIVHANNIDDRMAILDAEMNASYTESDHLLRFWKANLLLEAGRDPEALAEYVAVYETAPDSAWGMLAALHLEVVETE